MLPPSIYSAVMETGFVRSESAYNGIFDVMARPPAPALRPFFDAYAGYVDHTPAAFARRELPIGRVVFVISFGEPYRMSSTRSAEVTETSSFIAGMHDTSVLNEQPGPTAGIQINLTPIGAYLLLARPMDEIANRTVAVSDLFGAAGAHLTARLAEAPDWETRFRLLDALLLARITRARPASRGVAWAWRRIEETHGCIGIGGLAEDLGWSRKHLVAKFREQIGLPPKTIGRILRFNNAVRLIERGAELPWTEIAVRSGYYDQAHFIRDFSEFAGATPTEFVASRI
jgi:AraC-like DNA-binding protein